MFTHLSFAWQKTKGSTFNNIKLDQNFSAMASYYF